MINQLDTVIRKKVDAFIATAYKAEDSGLVDNRHANGQRHQCSLIITMLMTGLLAGRQSIRGIARLFHDPDYEEMLMEIFRPYFQLESFPSCSCLTRFLQVADTEGLAIYLGQWAYQLVDEAGATLRLWGVDGQATGAAKRQTEGGRPKYNVDYQDLGSDILVYMDPVEAKSQEAVMVEKSVSDVLSGHPNVVFGGDAMMAKLGILEGVVNADANAMLPVKRNNPKLMDGFCEVVEELTLEGSAVVDHYVDLNGEPDGVGKQVIKDTECTFEEEDNKKNGDNPKSRPIREVVFFEDVYPYADYQATGDDPADNLEGKVQAEGDDVADKGACADQEESMEQEDVNCLDETASADMGAVHQEEAMVSSEAKDVSEESVDEDICTGQKESDADASGVDADDNMVARLLDKAGENPGLNLNFNILMHEEEQVEANLAVPCVLNPDANGTWFRFGNKYIVLVYSHGRWERREYDLITNPAGCDIWVHVPEELKAKWEPYIETIGIATRYRVVAVQETIGKGKDKQTKVVYKGTVTRTAYMLTKPLDSAKDFGTLVRQYWGVEGKLHYVVDTLLGQDKCRCWVGNSTGNMSLLRKMAYNVLSTVKNAGRKIGKSLPYINIYEKLGSNLSYIRDLLFKDPLKAADDLVRNHCPATN